MNAKKLFVLLMAVLMVMSSVIVVSAADADKFAPANEEDILFHDNNRGAALGSYGIGASFGALFTVESGKRLTEINFESLATYNNNTNKIVFRVYQWDTDYKTTVKGAVLAQVTVNNHADTAALDVVLPTNRNMTGELLFTATYEDGPTSMTPWKTTGGDYANVTFFGSGAECEPFMFGITVADALTVDPAVYTATFMADGNEVAKVSFYEGDTELLSVPAVPKKEGFWGDWAAYTLENGDVTIEAVYTDASDAVKPEIQDASKMDAFSEDHLSFLHGEDCAVRVNRDGSVSFVGTWGLDEEVDAYATIDYLRLMTKWYEGYTNKASLPNKSEKFNVIVLKVKAPAVCLDSDPSMIVVVGRDLETYTGVYNTIKCDGGEEYWIFDFSEEKDFTTDTINTIKLNWAYSYGEDANLKSELIITGFEMFDTLDNALAATGSEKATEAPTEEKTEAPTDAPTEAPTQAPTEPTTEAPTTESGCTSVIGFGAVAVLAAAAAAVALKKKD